MSTNTRTVVSRLRGSIVLCRSNTSLEFGGSLLANCHLLETKQKQNTNWRRVAKVLQPVWCHRTICEEKAPGIRYQVPSIKGRVVWAFLELCCLPFDARTAAPLTLGPLPDLHWHVIATGSLHTVSNQCLTKSCHSSGIYSLNVVEIHCCCQTAYSTKVEAALEVIALLR